MTTALPLAYNPNDVRPGWGALVLVLALCVVVYLLWRSMNTQLGRIQMPPDERRRRTSIDQSPSAPSGATAVPPASGDAKPVIDSRFDNDEPDPPVTSR